MSDLEITLHVYRDLSNRDVGEDDQGPMARDAHRRRSQALHALLDAADVEVKDWQHTDDANSHELVDLVVLLKGSGGMAVAGAAGLAFYEILKAGLKDVVKDAVKQQLAKLMSGLWQAMTSKPKAVQDFWIDGPSGLQLQMMSDETVRVRWPDGTTKDYPKSEWHKTV